MVINKSYIQLFTLINILYTYLNILNIIKMELLKINISN